MHSVLIATGQYHSLDLLTDSPIPELRPLAGRPWIEHVVEILAKIRIRRVSVVICREPEAVRKVLGTGERWGLEIKYYTAKQPDFPYGRIKHLPLSSNKENIFLAHADRLPDLEGYDDVVTQKMRQTAFCAVHEDASTAGVKPVNSKKTWSGYAVVEGGWLCKLAENCNEESLNEMIRESVRDQTMKSVTLPQVLDARHHSSFLEANKTVLGKKQPEILIKSNEVQTGVWISRNVVIHPTVRIQPPVFLGENSNVEAQVELGPNAVIAADCVIDRKASVMNSVIMTHSYIGENLEVTDSIIDRNRLINTRLETALCINENFMLGSLCKGVTPSLWQKLPSRLAGLLLLVGLSPLLPIAAIYAVIKYRKGFLRLEKAVTLPAPDSVKEWRATRILQLGAPVRTSAVQPLLCDFSFDTFLLVFVPGLISVVFGDLHLVGLPPRAPENVEKLPEDWRKLYLQGKMGLITQNLLYHNARQDADENYAAETFYVAMGTWRRDAKFSLNYFGKVLQTICRNFLNYGIRNLVKRKTTFHKNS